jgi:PAS domain S-box-containing protein
MNEVHRLLPPRAGGLRQQASGPAPCEAAHEVTACGTAGMSDGSLVALREQAALLQATQRIARMAGWRLDLGCGRLTWSEGSCELFGMAAGAFEETFEQVRRLVLPEDRPAFERACALDAGEEADYRIRRPDGALRWLNGRGAIERDAAGAMTARIGIVMDLTEQRLARQAHDHDDWLLRIASEAARLGGWTIELPERKLTWSAANCVIHDVAPGYQPTLGEGIGYFLPEYREDVTSLVGACERDGTPYDFEAQKYTAKGRLIWVRCCGEAVRDGDGRIVRLQGSIQDISDRKRAEESLRRKDALLRIAGRVAQIGGWALELPQGRLSWSDEVFDVLELPRGEAHQLEDALALSPQRGRSLVRDALQRCITAGEPFDLEARIVTGRGRRIWVRLCGEAERDEHGTITRVQGAVQDTSRQKAAEHQIRSLGVRLTATLENITDGFFTLDRQWRLTYVNTAAERFLECPRGDLLGGHLWEKFQPAVGAVFKHHYERAVAENSTRSFEAFHAQLAKWFEVRVYPSPDGLAIYFRDITERVALEEQLRQAQRLDSIGRLTGGVAHDFNNLLTVIVGNAELLAELLAPQPKLAGLADMVVQAAERAATLTRHLLAFARKQPLQPRAVDANELVAKTAPLLQRTLGAHVEIVLAPAVGLWRALVDPAQLDAALLNLCVNARDAMPQGGRLTIATANHELSAHEAQLHPGLQPGHYVVLSVSDTGTGIAPEHLPRVFEPFFTTKEHGNGIGLGLAMVYGFAKQSEGHVHISSQPGHGTTVKLFLPRTVNVAAPQRTAADEPMAQGQQETILLVEDDQMVLRYAHEQLVALGYRVIQAADPARALDVLRGPEPVDLLFTDMVMPGMNGHQLANRALQLRPGLRVLYTSGYAEVGIVQEGRIDEGVHLLSKPYRREDLARRLRELLAQP